MSGKSDKRRKETKAERANFDKSKLWINIENKKTKPKQGSEK